jgi:hypothetical protein
LNHGISKLISNLSLIGLMRGPVMLPVWFGYDGDLDSIAFAVAIGEVVVQFGLIPANRAYAAWCRQVPTQSRDWKRAIVLALLLATALAALAMSAVLLADSLRLLPHQVSSLSVLAQALVLYSIIAAFYALRYLVWARGVLEYWIASVSCIVFLASALIVFAIDSYYWFALIALATALGVTAIGITSRKYFRSAISGTAT